MADGSAPLLTESRTGVREHLRRLIGFALLPACSILASIALLPLISETQGPDGWLALGVGQGSGAVVGVIAGLAWPTIGGNDVARATVDARSDIFVSSVYSRLLTLAALLPIATIVCLLLTDHFRVATTLFMVGASLNAMTAGWYYSGLGTPGRLVVNEGVVRLIGYAISALALLLGAPLAVYAGLTVAAGILSLALNWIHIVGRTLPRSTGVLRSTWTTITEHRLGTVSRVLLATFAYGITPIFTAFSPANAPTFAALDQLQRATSNGIAFVPQAFVAWVSGDTRHHRRRSLLAFTCIATVGALVLLVWTVAGPYLVEVLFSGEAQINRLGCFLVGLNAAASLVTVGYALMVMVPLGLQDQVFVVFAVAAVVGILLLAALAASHDVYLAFATGPILSIATLPLFAFLVHRHRRLTSTR